MLARWEGEARVGANLSVVSVKMEPGSNPSERRIEKEMRKLELGSGNGCIVEQS
jgi:hypothetical protein